MSKAYFAKIYKRKDGKHTTESHSIIKDEDGISFAVPNEEVRDDAGNGVHLPVNRKARRMMKSPTFKRKKNAFAQ